MKGLAGKVVAVTGGETGIGRAIVLRCAVEGAHVAAAGIQTGQLDEVIGQAEAAGAPGRVIAVPTDVRDQRRGAAHDRHDPESRRRPHRGVRRLRGYWLVSKTSR